ncbi:MAG: hypothetical protein IKW04_06680 [Clostridia bacterium]|nr:hypothetical protein [Clostridia bacterium]
MKSMKDLKRFSKEWWQNLWFYYKAHIIIGIIAAIVLAFTFHSCATQVKPDIYILFGGDFILTDEDYQILEERVKETITDVNGDGRITVNFIEIPIILETEYLNEATPVANEQLRNQFITGEQHIYVFDRVNFNRFYMQELLDPYTLFEYTAQNPLFEGTSLANQDLVMVTRYKRADMESDFTTSQQMIDRWATENTKERFQDYAKEENLPE